MDPIVEIFFEEAAELLADFEAGLLELEESRHDPELLNRIFRTAHTLKGNSSMLGFDDVTRFTHGLESMLDELRAGTLYVTPEVVDTLLAAGDLMRRMLTAAQTGGAVPGAEIDATLARLEVLGAPETPPAIETVADDVPTPEATEGPGAAAPGSNSIRVPIGKVDRLINLVGELVITQSMVAESVAALPVEWAGALAQVVAQMDRHARDLHEDVLAMRMMPVRGLFARVPRLVRDVAATLGKEVTVAVTGEDTELDRTVIERISDPLTHLVRNAIDHGLERPADRLAAGKPAAGELRLEAYQQGGSIYLEVADDGRGLDRDRIRARAEERGLVASGHELTDEQLTSLIFQPGFSTAEAVTAVSGRGVGMDVVRRNVEALGGAIAIRSERGRGTTFRIKLPLTLAIMDGQALVVGGHQYVIPLVAVRETVRPARGSIHTIGPGAELAIVHGDPLPILRLHRVFDVTPASEDPTAGLLVVVEHDGHVAAMLVDELLGLQQVVIKSLDSHFAKTRGIAGATILGDGRVALILDVADLVTLANASRTHLRAVA